jgi:hypothetical protein
MKNTLIIKKIYSSKEKWGGNSSTLSRFISSSSSGSGISSFWITWSF